ncbi:hypothetical protein MBLNU13_g11393t1 [Cladosporium sp. NU13]
MARKPKMEVHLDRDSNEFTTGDRIHGKVVIEAQAETHFDNIEIKLMGQSKTFVDLMSALPGHQEITKSSQTFLTLRQPGLELRYPLDRALQTGTTYEFPFEFVVPKRLVDGSCGHQIASTAVREAHLALPPSFSRHDGGEVDATVPETTIIDYGISATIFKSKKLNASKGPTTLATAWRQILVMPYTDTTLPTELNKTTRGGAPSDHCLRSVKKMSKGIIRSSLGTVTVEATQPKRLKLKRRDEESTHRFCTVPVNVMLRFDNKNRTAEAPQVSKITSRLEVNTFYTTSNHQDLPQKNASMYDRNRPVYTKHLPSTSFTPEKVVWQTVKTQDKDELNPEPAHLEVKDPTTDTLSPPNSSSKTANMLVPVSIPVPTTLAPTFHSCLISRTYVLETSIKLTSQGCTRTANLRLPLQISTDMSDHLVDHPTSEHVAMDTLLPGYFEGGYTNQTNPERTYEELTARDMEDELLSQQLASLACADSPPPPAYCIYL